METTTASQELAARVRKLREKRGLSYRELEAKLREHGNPIVASSLLKLERAERRTDVDELAALAVVLRTTVLDLLGLDPVAAAREPEPADPGRMESVTRDGLAQLGELSPLEPMLVETAYRLAAAVDRCADDRELRGLTRELRATVEQIAAGRRRDGDDDDDDFGDLDEPE